MPGNNGMARLAAASGALAVAAGAFGAHALKDSLSAEQMDVWKTAASYHLVHSVLIAALAKDAKHGAATSLLAAGVTVFSGSLYLLVLTGVKKLGAITPIGGVLLILGWMQAARDETQ